MKFCKTVATAAISLILLAAGITAAQAQNAINPGLWLGTVTIDRVSEVHKRPGDMSFDLGITAIVLATGEDVLVPSASDWKFDDKADDQWRGPAGWPRSSATGWQNGSAPLGYVDSTNAPAGGTKVGYGNYVDWKNPATYFRKTFTVSDAVYSRLIDASYPSSLRFRVWRDDGVVIYLNGKEVRRDNCKLCMTGYESWANYNETGGHADSEISGDPSANPIEFDISASNLKKGNNELSVAVYTSTGPNPDLYFDLELKGLSFSKTYLSPDVISDESGNWQYNDSGAAPPQLWTSPTFTDVSAWKTGSAPFGFGRDYQQTRVANKAAVYFRKSVTITDPSIYKGFNIRLLRDDGAIVYLNGKELVRSNMPSGPVSFDTPPVQVITSSEGDKYYKTSSYTLQPGYLLTGTNVVAVEVHQHPEDLHPPPSSLTKTPAEFPVRVLLHVDSLGNVRLLKEAILAKDSADTDVVLADSARAYLYKGVANRGDVSIGLRTSVVGFDFSGAWKECSGAVSASAEAICSFTLPFDHPDNPFLHRYHPDHDNLDARFENVTRESFDIARSFKMTFSDRYPPNPDEQARDAQSRPPGWGYSVLGGTYGETFTGLHRDDLSVSGWFILQRISETAEIRQ